MSTVYPTPSTELLALRTKAIYAFDMRPFPGKSLITVILAVALAGVLIILAVLQFSWVNKIAQAERDRMETGLEMAIVRFRWDFYSQLLHVCSAFQVNQTDLSTDALQSYADRYQDWMHASTRPHLVAAVYIWKAKNRPGHRLFRLNWVTDKHQPSAWPPEFQTLHAAFRRGPNTLFHRTRGGESPRHWYLVEQVPALVRVFWNSEQTNARLPEGYAVIELNMKYIQTSLFPLLVERYFRGPRGLVYRVEIISRRNPGEVIYQSAPSQRVLSRYPPDAVVDLISVHHAGLIESPFPRVLEKGSDLNRGGNPVALSAPQSPNGFAPLIVLAGKTADWQMVVRHRSGSVQATVVALRHRDLAVSLGVLVVLALSIGLIMVSAQRAQRLARIQMDFVAGISHELRTPLAVICSAADNLADGVVGAGNQVKEYGALIRSEGRHLAEMVEQTLGFAAQQAARHSEDRIAVEVEGVLDAAVAQAGLAAEFSGIQVEKRIHPGLPPVLAHPPALIRCIQNLLANAAKYGGESHWVRLSARAISGRRKPEVEITVQDHGIGIPPSDLPHIFEPFYRGRSREVVQIRGTGLGLSLARDIAEGMGGTLSVKSEVSKGSSFILRLPAAAAIETPLSPEIASSGVEGFETASK